VLPIVKLQPCGSKTPSHQPRPLLVPANGRSSLICEAIIVQPEQHVAYVFELRREEKLEFVFFSNMRIKVWFCKAADYDRWTESDCDFDGPELVYIEAIEASVHRVKFTTPKEEAYVVLLINGGGKAADVAVEIRLSLPAILW
jgi:hypothetical protein